MKVASKNSWVVTKEVKGELMVMSVNGEHPESVEVGFRLVASCADLNLLSTAFSKLDHIARWRKQLLKRQRQLQQRPMIRQPLRAQTAT